jgi:hypothetical protein
LENRRLQEEQKSRSAQDPALNRAGAGQEKINRGDSQDKEANHEGRQAQHVDGFPGE